MTTVPSPQEILTEMGLCSPATIEVISDRVRDRDDVQVLRCQRSGVIFLSRSDHLSAAQWTEQSGFGYWSAGAREDVLASARTDDERRADMFGDLVRNRRWLDVGAGVGGVIEQLRSVAREITAVEPQPQAREALLNSGYRAVRDLSNLAGEQFDVVTLFHVFEHLLDPQATLRQVHELMSTDGRVVIEVPHARDLLLSLLKVEAFMAFTFWSEHLILHTRESLTTFLEKAGFRDVSVQGVQRYPLANHLRWLHSSEPGGHETWRQLRSPGLDQEYQAMLDRLDATDTIVATARV